MGRRGLAVAATALVTTLQFPPSATAAVLERSSVRGSSPTASGFTAETDLPLEGEGFEPSVPLATASLILAEEKGLQADPAQAGTAA